MKGMKKLLSILMVLTLVLSLGATAFAATVTIDQGRLDKDSTYSAYKLMTATYKDEQEVDGELTKVYEYHLNEDFLAAIGAGITAVGGDISVTMQNENAVIKYISELTSDQARTFADGVYKYIQDNSVEATKTAKAGEDGKATFTDMDGYYLIAETVGEGTLDAVTSLVMLDTAGQGEDTISVKTKEEVPTAVKKVQEKNDTTGTTGAWQDGADWDIGDDVPFLITGTLPQDYSTYTSYKVVFHDKQSQGLTLNPESVKVTVGGTELKKGMFDVTTEGLEDGCTFEIVINNVKEVAPNAGNGATIVVDYTAKLNELATIGPGGNPNEMQMEYSNDHYSDGTGKTTWDKVKVFTFKLVVNKVNGVNEPLTGAAFTLWKLYPAAYEVPEGTESKNVEDGEGKWVSRKVIGPGEDISEFNFEGLDSGVYLLEETKVPAGYNGIDPIKFTVKASYDENNVNDPQLTNLEITDITEGATFTVEKAEGGALTGVFKTDVMNLTGVELPETGGIGTTIFYVAGAVLAAAAVVLLVTKRRVNGAEK